MCLKAEREHFSLSTLPSLCPPPVPVGSANKTLLAVNPDCSLGTGINSLIGAGTSNKNKCFPGEVCLDLRLLALDVMKASCLSPGAAHTSTTITHQTLLRAANFFPREQQQPATKTRLLSNSIKGFLKQPPEGAGQ